MATASLRGMGALRAIDRLRKRIEVDGARLTDRDLALLEIALVALLEVIRIYRKTR